MLVTLQVLSNCLNRSYDLIVIIKGVRGASTAAIIWLLLVCIQGEKYEEMGCRMFVNYVVCTDRVQPMENGI